MAKHAAEPLQVSQGSAHALLPSVLVFSPHQQLHTSHATWTAQIYTLIATSWALSQLANYPTKIQISQLGTLQAPSIVVYPSPPLATLTRTWRPSGKKVFMDSGTIECSELYAILQQNASFLCILVPCAVFYSRVCQATEGLLFLPSLVISLYTTYNFICQLLNTSFNLSLLLFSPTSSHIILFHDWTTWSLQYVRLRHTTYSSSPGYLDQVDAMM